MQNELYHYGILGVKYSDEVIHYADRGKRWLLKHGYIIKSGELMHYGVKGMKWGVRKKDQQQILDIHRKLSNRDVYYLGYNPVSKYTVYAKTKKGAYITLDDYGGKHKDEHPHSGKIISIAASPQSRGTGVTSELIKQAIKDNPNSRLIAEIDSTNIHSNKLFIKNGFKLIDVVDDIQYYEYLT